MSRFDMIGFTPLRCFDAAALMLPLAISDGRFFHFSPPSPYDADTPPFRCQIFVAAALDAATFMLLPAFDASSPLFRDGFSRFAATLLLIAFRHATDAMP